MQVQVLGQCGHSNAPNLAKGWSRAQWPLIRESAAHNEDAKQCDSRLSGKHSCLPATTFHSHVCVAGARVVVVPLDKMRALSKSLLHLRKQLAPNRNLKTAQDLKAYARKYSMQTVLSNLGAIDGRACEGTEY